MNRWNRKYEVEADDTSTRKPPPQCRSGICEAERPSQLFFGFVKTFSERLMCTGSGSFHLLFHFFHSFFHHLLSRCLGGFRWSDRFFSRFLFRDRLFSPTASHDGKTHNRGNHQYQERLNHSNLLSSGEASVQGINRSWDERTGVRAPPFKVYFIQLALGKKIIQSGMESTVFSVFHVRHPFVSTINNKAEGVGGKGFF